ncbi:hypothetical protein AB1Y20_013154 [Prymnesium parvum]|uniref:Uncharacterized protein n=1 Tax=Prymnesium parvum TaxID=97485 RepID=A0AB34ILD8_PRYPA
MRPVPLAALLLLAALALAGVNLLAFRWHISLPPSPSILLDPTAPPLLDAHLPEPLPATPLPSIGRRDVSCPLYSGPGYDRRRHPSRQINVPAFEAPYLSAPRPARRAALAPLPPSLLRLLPGSPFADAFDTNLRFLRSVDTAALLLSWQLNAPRGAWPKGTFRLMGWEHTGSELRGHFLGHWLSSCAIAFAATRDEAVGAAMAEVVAQLDAIAAARGDGYLSAFPDSFLTRLEAQTPVWAPYYTLHKLLAGLLQQHALAGSEAALRLSEGLAAYIDGRVHRVIDSKSIEHHFETLHQECGGINEGLWSLAALTRQPQHRALASLFDKPCLMGPLADGKDELTGMHGNTALALLLGAQRRFEVTGEPHFLSLAVRFFDLIERDRSFATGGTTLNELWGRPGELGHTVTDSASGMGFEQAESCTTHNLMRLAVKLLCASGGEMRYADYLEKALLNGVLGTQRGLEPGMMLYFYPLGSRVSKAAPQAWRHAGWSTPYGDWWCCMGTGIEAFARMAELVFFQSTHDSQSRTPSRTLPELYVLQLVPTLLNWTLGGLRLRLDAAHPAATSASTPAKLRLTVDAGGPVEASILLRVPYWAVAPSATIGNAAVPAERVQAGKYLRIRRVWREGDAVCLTLPFEISTSRLPDRREHFSRLHAIRAGPTVLGCVGCATTKLQHLSAAEVARLVRPVPLAARTALRSLHRAVARGAAEGSVFVHADALWIREGAVPATPFRHRRRGATDVHLAMTFRIVAGLVEGVPNLISFEAIHRPGCFIAAPEQRAPAEAFVQLRLGCLQLNNATASQQMAASFRRHDPLLPTAHGAFQSYESVSMAGHFISSFEAPAAEQVRYRGSPTNHPGRLRKLGLVQKPATTHAARANQPTPFALESSFEEAPGEAEYPLAAWWLFPPPPSRPAGGSLLYPLYEIVDETYSVYWALR